MPAPIVTERQKAILRKVARNQPYDSDDRAYLAGLAPDDESLSRLRTQSVLAKCFGVSQPCISARIALERYTPEQEAARESVQHLTDFIAENPPPKTPGKHVWNRYTRKWGTVIEVDEPEEPKPITLARMPYAPRSLS